MTTIFNLLLQEAGPGKLVGNAPLSEGWLLFILIVPLLLYIIVLNLQRAPLIWLSRVVFNNRYSANAYRNRTYGRQLGHSLLLVISAFGLATIGYFAEFYFKLEFYNLNGFTLWLFNLLILSFSFGFRYVIITVAGNLTGSKDAFSEYGFNIAQFYKFIAVPLLLINFLIPYFDYFPEIVFLVIAGTLMVILLIIRIIRLISIFIRRGFLLLYFILYLCALEITPALVFIKYLSGAV